MTGPDTCGDQVGVLEAEGGSVGVNEVAVGGALGVTDEGIIVGSLCAEGLLVDGRACGSGGSAEPQAAATSATAVVAMATFTNLVTTSSISRPTA
ncbi:hypothetical protein [Kribbella catacumbae]|uniref:hypothetical protein n=1 Tax=Kribbella catacumbae TaxID=460086 RepID=UPI000374BCFC|nr:hypothetical protein [Kribbella catacumbae]